MKKQVQQLFQTGDGVACVPGGIQTRKQLDFSKQTSTVKKNCVVRRTKVQSSGLKWE